MCFVPERVVVDRAPYASSRRSHLFELSRLSQKDVAARLGITTQAVQSTEQRALRKIRIAMLADPDVMVAHDPEWAEEKGVEKVLKVGAASRKVALGGKYLTPGQREELAGWRQLLRIYQQSGQTEAAEELSSVLAQLERNLAAL